MSRRKKNTANADGPPREPGCEAALPRRRLSVGKKIVFACIPLIIVLGIVEAVFRFKARDEPVAEGRFIEPDADLLWRLRQTAEGPLATNELGYRDGPYNSAAEQKVLLLGDSVAWGDGMPHYRYCFPYLIEEALNTQGGGTLYEVINASVPGYSTFQQAACLERDGLALNPDLIVVQFCLNDVTSRYANVAAYGGKTNFMGVDTRSSITGVAGVLVRYSRAAEALVRTLQVRARATEEYDVKNLASDMLSEELEAAWQLVLGELDDIVDLAEANDIPVLLVIVPYRFQLAAPGSTRQPQDRLIAFARSRGVRYVDLLPELALGPRVHPLFNDPSHFSTYGHQRAAEVVTPAVARMLGD